ncbi:MAG TPA: ABC transporter substrate-binding protein [Burkholderiaceae bacterium]|nr:ABC transporter substrate-binding protein [Burkholderiaceae bacterium]
MYEFGFPYVAWRILRTHFMRIALGCLLFATVLAASAAKLPRLVLSGPPALVSAPLIHMVETGALADIADKVSFVQWRDPDLLRAMVLDGKADVLAVPSNVAANLYNRGAPIALMNISTWGALWMVSRSPDKKTLADFRGAEIAMPFRGDMPDIMFQLLTAKQGLDARKDFRLRYVATPIDAMQLLIMRRVDHALLVEPAISMALRKTHSFPLKVVAPELYRSADMQKEYGRLFARAARIPQAGIAAVGSLRAQPEALARIDAAYAKSLAYCRDHAQECGKLMAKHITMLTPEAVADAIAVSQLDAVPAARARGELTFFLDQLRARNPALIGGKLPDDGFYAASRP